MKLRIRGNSIRLRVSKSELDAIAQLGRTEDAVQFAPNAVLRYRIEATNDAFVTARFSASEVAVGIPRAAVQAWLAPDQVSIVGEQEVGGGEQLAILVEKDFECLAPRSGEDDSDLFANPLKAGSDAD